MISIYVRQTGPSGERRRRQLEADYASKGGEGRESLSGAARRRRRKGKGKGLTMRKGSGAKKVSSPSLTENCSIEKTNTVSVFGI